MHEVGRKIDSFNRNQLVMMTETRIRNQVDLDNDPPDIPDRIEEAFTYLFWHAPSKTPIREVDAQFFLSCLTRLRRSAEPNSARKLGLFTLQLWSHKGLIEPKNRHISDIPEVIRLSDEGEDFLKKTYDSLPGWWLVIKDLWQHPLAILGYIVGLISGVLAILDWLRGSGASPGS